MFLTKEGLKRFGDNLSKKISDVFVNKTEKMVLHDDVVVETIHVKSKSYVSRYKGYGNSVIANTRQAFGVKECLIPAGKLVSRIAFEVTGFEHGEIIEGIQVIAVKNADNTIFENVILNGKGVVKDHDGTYFNTNTKIVEVEIQKSFTEAVYLLVACNQRVSGNVTAGMALYRNTTLSKVSVEVPNDGVAIGTVVNPFMNNNPTADKDAAEDIISRNSTEELNINSFIVYEKDYKFDLNIEKNISNDSKTDRGNAQLANILLGCRAVRANANDYIKNVYIRLADDQTITTFNSLDVYAVEKKEAKHQDVMMQHLYRSGEEFSVIIGEDGRRFLKIPVNKSFDKEVFFVFKTPVRTNFRFNARDVEQNDNFLTTAGTTFNSNGMVSSDSFETNRYNYTIHTYIEAEESFIENVFKRLDALEQNSNKNVDARR
ncbi:hypothetical protein [uncultured Clostridium sp.]|uniref:hypothetical protein n=1 Tax=uncultured Clostridium sp. TaxID=59620 RepID=UPI0020471B52|nr:hypothetical protein [uncultured Clostridium sp.]DAP53323.1 MAG TPA: hypothetical protein [Caudoviricetes sp.]